MYVTSQSTSGIEIASQATVMFETLWHHAVSLISRGEGGATAATELDTARLVSDLADE